MSRSGHRWLPQPSGRRRSWRASGAFGMMGRMHPQQPEDYPDDHRNNPGNGPHGDYRPVNEPSFGTPLPRQQRWDGSPDPRPVDERGGDEDQGLFMKYRAVWVVLITLITLLVAWGLLQTALEVGF